MKMLSTLLIIALIAAGTFFLVGCKGNVAKGALEKALNVVNIVEVYVGNASPSNIVSTIKAVETPLSIVNNALVYIGGVVDNADAKEKINKAAEAVADILKTVNEVDEASLADLKEEILTKVAQVKLALETAAVYVGADLTPDVSILKASINPEHALQEATEELRDLLKSAN